MISEFRIAEVVRLSHGLVTAANMVKGEEEQSTVSDAVLTMVRDDCKELLPFCDALVLDVPAEYIRQGLVSILDPALMPRPIGNAVIRLANSIVNTIEIQLRSRVFLALDPESKRLYNTRYPLGTEQEARFPDASWELEESSKCLALGRATASAFHSIRCLEAGLRAISRCLKIPDPTRAADRNWGAVLKSLKAAMDTRWPNSTARLDGDGEFFDNAYAALAAMQNPWRNATMHLDQKYTDQEAKHVLEVVTGFMTRLAVRMDEEGKPFA